MSSNSEIFHFIIATSETTEAKWIFVDEETHGMVFHGTTEQAKELLAKVHEFERDDVHIYRIAESPIQ